MSYQRTIRAAIHLEGVGLHSGAAVHLKILPATPDHGLVFRRTDITPHVEIPARVEAVVDTALATVLGAGEVRISTVEHCLAALAGLGVDNAVIEVDGPELPILDGSALPYVEAILAVGWRRQHRTRKVLRVTKPIRVAADDKFCLLRPARGFQVTYSIEFEGRFPEDQHYFLNVSEETFATELAMARTFGFLEDVQYLRSVGKARGGSLDNAVVLSEGRVLNPEGLRIRDELVRHKILDAVGDLALAGVKIQGHLIVHKGGHALHAALVHALLQNPDAWELVEAGGRHVPQHVPAPCRMPLVHATA